MHASIESGHWWFVIRHRLFFREINTLNIPKNSAVLEVGSSTGVNLNLLNDMDFTWITAIDRSEIATQFCSKGQLSDIVQGDGVCLPFKENTFSLVLATDFLEHVEMDGSAIGEIYRVLLPGGTALITVPAFKCLWGLEDQIANHLRRYRLQPFRSMFDRVGFHIQRCYYFNYILFAPIWITRKIIHAMNLPIREETQINSSFLNVVCKMIFNLDTLTARWLHPPFGVSILLTVKKP